MLLIPTRFTPVLKMPGLPGLALKLLVVKKLPCVRGPNSRQNGSVVTKKRTLQKAVFGQSASNFVAFPAFYDADSPFLASEAESVSE
jgi:hypothetical protein